MTWIQLIGFIVSMFGVASLCHLCHVSNKLRNEALDLAKHYKRRSEAWEAKAMDYRQRWHESTSDDFHVARDKRAVLQFHDDKIVTIHTATLPRWIFDGHERESTDGR